jgi:hypothetical protein
MHFLLILHCDSLFFNLVFLLQFKILSYEIKLYKDSIKKYGNEILKKMIKKYERSSIVHINNKASLSSFSIY